MRKKTIKKLQVKKERVRKKTFLQFIVEKKVLQFYVVSIYRA